MRRREQKRRETKKRKKEREREREREETGSAKMRNGSKETLRERERERGKEKRRNRGGGTERKREREKKEQRTADGGRSPAGRGHLWRKIRGRGRKRNEALPARKVAGGNEMRHFRAALGRQAKPAGRLGAPRKREKTYRHFLTRRRRSEGLQGLPEGQKRQRAPVVRQRDSRQVGSRGGSNTRGQTSWPERPP